MFHAVETRTFLVVRLNDCPWRVRGVGIEEHRFLRLRIILPFIQRLAIDGREFPFFQKFFSRDLNRRNCSSCVRENHYLNKRMPLRVNIRSI